MVMFNLLAASGTGSQTDINSYVDTRNIIHLFVNIIKQLTYHGFQNLVNAWISPLQTLLIDMPLLYSPWIVFILAGLSGSVTLLYGVLNLDSPEGKSNKLSWKKGGLITFVGISLLCVGVLPVSIIGKNIQLDWFVFTRWYVFAGIGATTLWISMVAVLGLFTYQYGWMWLLKYYAGPYIVFIIWLDLVTFLHHTEPGIPWYRGEEWTFLKGAISSVDRDYGIFNHIHHDIGTHVAHHIFLNMPHYNLLKATEAIKPIMGEYFHESKEPVWKSLWNSAIGCHFVPDTGSKVYYTSKSQNVK